MANPTQRRRVTRWLLALWRGPESPLLRVIWRLVGVAMLLLVWRLHGDDPWRDFTRMYPPAYGGMAVAAAALVVLGGRPVVLVAASVAWVLVIVAVNGGEEARLRFIADEYLLFAAVPGLAGLATLLATLEHRPEVDPPLAEVVAAGQRWQLKLCALTTLGFSVVHKLNADFFDPQRSCARFVERELSSLWHAPGWLLPPPWLFLLFEAAAPILLVLRPRVGVVAVLLLSVGLGHTGPFAFTTLVLALSLAFLPAAAAGMWAARWRQIAVGGVAAGLMVAVASAALYRADKGWLPYLAFDLVLTLVLVLLLATWGAGHSARGPWLPWLPGRYAQRTLGVYAALLLLVNGMSPYLGLKFRYSFAMVSNLRVDDSRWNSYLFPAWMRVVGDPLVHVVGVLDLQGAPMELPETRAPLLRIGVYSPQEFKRRQIDAQRRRIRGTLRLRYLGEEYTFADYAYSSAMQRFVAGLPERRLFQSELSLDTPQKCVH